MAPKKDRPNNEYRPQNDRSQNEEKPLNRNFEKQETFDQNLEKKHKQIVILELRLAEALNKVESLVSKLCRTLCKIDMSNHLTERKTDMLGQKKL